MKTTRIAAAFVSNPDLTTYTDTELEQVEAWAKAIANGHPVRITHHTPRGRVLSASHGKHVLEAVHNEQTRRVLG